MFEDFSFTSPSSRPARLALEDDRLMVDTDSLISPLSSRCPSPQSRLRNRRNFRSQPPTSVPFPYEDHKDHKRLSISTLTQKLHEHTLAPGDRDRISPGFRTNYTGYVLTPPDTDHDDESLSPSSPTFPISESSDDIRSRRQHISRLQCNESEIEAMRSLIEEPEEEEDCHPSSLPPRHSPRRRAMTLSRSRFGPEERRRKSSAGVLASRVEKDRHGHGHGHGHGPGKRMDGLRRKSLVSAALASMVEKE
ncbi:unnamed protein product [Penicillium salamii]|nr:unnamed protein product [Penicillium salamii]